MVKKAEQPVVAKTNTLAIISLILAIFIPPIGFILALVSLSQIKKSKESGKGLAIAGLVISIIEMVLTVILISMIYFAATAKPALIQYRNNDIGYSIDYPEKWKVTDESTAEAKGVIFKDESSEPGQVYGQEEVVYIGPPANGYTSDVLVAIKDSFVKTNKATIISESTQDFKGLPSIQFTATYAGKNGQVKAKGMIIKNKDNSVYTVVVQTPEKNWDRLEETFNNSLNSFNP